MGMSKLPSSRIKVRRDGVGTKRLESTEGKGMFLADTAERSDYHSLYWCLVRNSVSMSAQCEDCYARGPLAACPLTQAP